MTDALVAALAASPGLAERLLAEHRAGPDGRCRVCVIGGQRGRPAGACRTYQYARLALELRRTP